MRTLLCLLILTFLSLSSLAQPGSDPQRSIYYYNLLDEENAGFGISGAGLSQFILDHIRLSNVKAYDCKDPLNPRLLDIDESLELLTYTYQLEQPQDSLDPFSPFVTVEYEVEITSRQAHKIGLDVTEWGLWRQPNFIHLYKQDDEESYYQGGYSYLISVKFEELKWILDEHDKLWYDLVNTFWNNRIFSRDGYAEASSWEFSEMPDSLFKGDYQSESVRLEALNGLEYFKYRLLDTKSGDFYNTELIQVCLPDDGDILAELNVRNLDKLYRLDSFRIPTTEILFLSDALLAGKLRSPSVTMMGFELRRSADNDRELLVTGKASESGLLLDNGPHKAIRRQPKIRPRAFQNCI